MGEAERETSPDRDRKTYIGYEYKEIMAEDDRAALLMDGYESFGWELDGRLTEDAGRNAVRGERKVRLRFRRDRKIINKAELTRLQRNFEACMAEIQALEKKKTSAATIYALVVGLIGTAFIAGATFAVTAQPPHYVLCVVLAVFGFAGWLLPYFLYKKMQERKTEQLTPLIEAKYDEVYEICEKGHRLLY